MAKKPKENDKRYISLDEFKTVCNGRTKNTIRRNKSRIPGYETDSKILEGTRYPYKVGNFRPKDDYDKRLIVLKAISVNEYIDSKMLGIYERTFVGYLDDFVSVGYIRKINSSNKFGANEYDCTMRGSEVAKLAKNKAKKELMKDLAAISGTFVGNVLSSMNP